MKNKKNEEHLEIEEAFPKKWLNKLPEGFFEAAQSMSAEELKTRLITSEQTVSSTEKEMDNDQKLNTLKEDVKLLSSGYREVLSAQKAVIRAVVFVLNSRGNS